MIRRLINRFRRPHDDWMANPACYVLVEERTGARVERLGNDLFLVSDDLGPGKLPLDRWLDLAKAKRWRPYIV